MSEYEEKYKRSNSVCDNILEEEHGKHCISCEAKIVEDVPTCPKPKPIVPGKVENYVQDDHYVHTDNNFTDDYKEKIDDLVGNAQSDWEETDSELPAYIKNKPTIPTNVSDLTNDSGFQTSTQVQTTVNNYHDSTKQDVITDLDNIRSGAELGATALQSVPLTYRTVVEQDIIDNNKVEKVDGKGLSTNDYTTTDKDKLAGIADGAEVNVQSDWNAASGDASIKNKPIIPSNTSELSNDSGFITQSAIVSHNNDISAHSSIRTSISNIEGKIPADASTTNQLADKDFVNSSIENVAAFYITKDAVGSPFATKAELNSSPVVYSGGEIRIPTRNDYCVVLKDESQTITETGENPTTRYIYGAISVSYSPANWSYQYTVNNLGLTASQLQAVNSGITGSGVTQITTNKNDITSLNNTKISKPATQGTEGQFLALDVLLNPVWKSSSSTVAWGSVTGTLSSQTDLQDALNLKANTNDIPTNVSDLTNDSGFQTTSQVQDTVNNYHDSTKQDIISDIESIRSGAALGATALQSVPSTYRTSNEQDIIDNNKVDTVDGKGLSTNDYTTTDKNKLAGIADGAEVNVQSDWNAASGDASIKNKPIIPTNVSDLTNDSGFQTEIQVQTTVNNHHDSTKQDVITDLDNIRSGAELGATALQSVPLTYRTSNEQDIIDNNKVDKVDGKGLSTNDYTTTDKNKLAGIADGAEVNVQSDWNQTNTTADDYIKNKPTIPAAANDGVLTIQRNSTQLGTFSANQSTNQTINISVPTELSELTDDSTHRTITDTEKSTWNGKSVVSGTNDGTKWTTITIDGTTMNIPSGGGGGGGLTDYNFTFLLLTNNTTTYTFAADQRCYQHVTMTAGATINFQINNSSDNYVRFYNSSASDITLAIGSVTFNGSSVPTIIPDDTVSVKAGKYVEIGVIANSTECDITISSGLKLK